MKFSVSSKEQSRSSAKPSQHRTAETENAGQPPRLRKVNRLASNYILALCAGFTIPPIVLFVCFVGPNLQSTIVVTAYISLVIFYVLSAMVNLHGDLTRAKIRIYHLQADNRSLETAYRRSIERYNSNLAVPIRIKRISRKAVAGSSGVSSEPATVVEFPKED